MYHIKQRGFTLVELAVVLVIIGLIAGAILGGRQLMEVARRHTVLKEEATLQEAITAFKDKYHELPGDMGNATSFWASAADGNRDQMVVWTDGSAPKKEGPQAWYQLVQGGFLSGNYSGSSSSDLAVPGTNTPTTAIGGGTAGWFIDADASYDIGTAIGIGRSDGSGLNDTALFTAESAYFIDKKVDDGLPSAGSVRGVGGSCINTGEYDITGSDDPTCTLRFGLDANRFDLDLQ